MLGAIMDSATETFVTRVIRSKRTTPVQVATEINPMLVFTVPSRHLYKKHDSN